MRLRRKSADFRSNVVFLQYTPEMTTSVRKNVRYGTIWEMQFLATLSLNRGIRIDDYMRVLRIV